MNLTIMLEINQVKLERQKWTLHLWKNAGYKGVADYYPGTGKTFLGILAIDETEETIKGVYVISTPNDIILKQWASYIVNLPKHLQNRIVLKTKNQLLTENIIYKDVSAFIIDEIHECTTESNEPLLNGTIVYAKRILGLTGTTGHVNFKNVTKYLPIIDVISEQEAKSKGFVAEMIEYNLALTLNEKELITYNNYSDAISKNMVLFNNNLRLVTFVCYGGKHPDTGVTYPSGQWAMSIAMQNGWHNKLDLNIPNHKEIDRVYNPSAIISNAHFLMIIINKRKKFLSDLKIKEETVLKLVKKFKGVKTIVFSESTAFADRIGIKLNENKIPTVVFHSKLKTVYKPGKTGKLIKFGAGRLKTEAIDAIKHGLADVISTTKALDKGLDVLDLRFSIITSGTTSINQEIQRKSRAGRKEAENDDPVLHVNLYVKDTVDEKWLNTRQQNNATKPIFVDSIEAISYRPQPNYFTYEDL